MARDPLTPGEFTALLALARYGSTRRAADALSVAQQTIANQSQRAFTKLGVANRTDAFKALGWLRVPTHNPVAMRTARARRRRVRP